MALSSTRTGRLAQAGTKRSVGGVGNGYDKAPDWTINGLCLAGLIHRERPWLGLATVEIDRLDGMDRDTTRQLLSALGAIPPAHAEADHHAALEPTAMRASESSKPLGQPGLFSFFPVATGAPRGSS